MRTFKGEFKVLCPYFIREREKGIECEKDGVHKVMFDSAEKKTEWRNAHCWFAIPKGCEVYDEHAERIAKGEEKRIPPRSNMDLSKRVKHTNYIRERRKDPNYKY